MSTTPDPPPPLMEAPKRRRIPSAVWLAPLIAVGVSAALLWREYAERGPLVQIIFPTAAGLTAGQTPVRYRDVEVGKIESLRFTPDLGAVIAEARMEPDVAPYLDADARFWIVRPQVTAQGITGLETVISGAYIRGDWNAEQGAPLKRFEALTDAPLTTSDEPGKRVRLRAADGGSLSVGAPIFYRRVEVGRVESKRLTADGSAVEFDIFIDAPNDRRLTTETRFWNVSGVDLSFGAGGAQLRIASLAALVQGGAAFDTPRVSPGDPASTDQIYALYPTEAAARERALEADPGAQLLVSIGFEGSVRGLSPGAPVQYQGVAVGQVVDLAADADPVTGVFETRTTIALSPEQLGLPARDIPGARDFLANAVARGLRARLSTESILTGSLYVDLVEDPAAAPAVLEIRPDAPPRMPAIESDQEQVATSIEGVFERVDALPVEEVMASVITLLQNVNAIIGSEAARQTPERALSVLASIDALLASPELTRAPGEFTELLTALRQTVAAPEVTEARDAIAALAGSAARVAARLEAEDAAGDAAAALAALRTLLEDPEVARLAPALAGALENASALLAAPGMREAPEALTAALDSLAARLDDPALAALPAETARALAGVSDRLEDPALARSIAALPGLIEAAQAGVAGAEPLIADARTELIPLLASLREIAEAPGLRRAPDELAATLTALRARLEDPALAAATGDLAASLAALREAAEAPETRAALAALAPLAEESRAAVSDIRASIGPTLEALRALLDSPGVTAAPEELAATLASARALLDEPGLRDAAREAALTLASLRAILDAPGTRAAPEELAGALGSARALLDALERENAAGALAAAANAAEGLLADPALRALSGDASRTLAAINDVLGAPGATELPEATRRALTSIAALLDQIERENVAASAAGALTGVGGAADAVRRALADAPALLARLIAVSDRTETLLASVSVGSELNYETVTAIREMRDAARAITDLADLVQRQPNALILGK